MVRAFLAVLLVLGPAAVAEAAPGRVLVTGDSMVQPLDDLLVRPVERRGGRVLRDPRPASGLTRPLVLDWEKHARRQVRKRRPRVTVMFVGASDTEPLTTASGRRVLCCHRDWIDAYADRVEQMMRTYVRRKRRQVYWLTLPLPRQQDRRPQFLAINYAIAQAARKASTKAHVVDTVPVLSPGNRYHRRLRYRGQSVVVRDGDGVHLTAAGSRIARDLVLRAMRRNGVIGHSSAAAGTASLVYEKPLPELEIGAEYALSVQASPGDSNQIAVAETGDAFTITDSGAPLQPGEGCTALSAQTVRCPMPREVEARTVFVDAGNGPDRVSLGGVLAATLAEARGGGGGDVIFGSGGDDALDGGAGADGLAGGDGDDLLDGGGGADVIAGGPGTRDGVSYQGRTQPVTVDLAEGTGGGRNEGDALAEVEVVIGGSAADVIRGTSATDILFGGEGAARDQLAGRAGDDGLTGYRAIGGRGDDILDAQRPACGRDEDSIFRRTYNSAGPFPRECERIIAIFVVLQPQPIASSRQAVVFGVRCRLVRCRGELELRDGRGRIGRKRFSLQRREDDLTLHEVRIPLARRPDRRVPRLVIHGVRAYERSSFRTRLP